MLLSHLTHCDLISPNPRTSKTPSVQNVRAELHGHLNRINPDKNWDFIVNQIGMFSFTGLSPAQARTPLLMRSLLHKRSFPPNSQNGPPRLVLYKCVIARLGTPAACGLDDMCALNNGARHRAAAVQSTRQLHLPPVFTL